MLVAGITTRRPRIRVTGNAADSQHDAAMLDGAVRVVEHCADDPDLRPQGMANHFRQPVRGDHLDVVVPKADDLTAGTTGAELVIRGVVERQRPAAHAGTGAVHDLLDVLDRLAPSAILVRDAVY